MAIIAREWKPKPQQLAAARYLAIGATWEYTMQKCDVSRDSISRWIKQPQFSALIDEYRQRAFEFVEPTIWGNLQLALEVQRQVFTGEIPPDDGRIVHADKLLDRFYGKLTAVQVQDTVGAAASPPAAAIQINNHYGGPNGTHALAAGQPIDYTGAIEGERTNGTHPVHDADE